MTWTLLKTKHFLQFLRGIWHYANLHEFYLYFLLASTSCPEKSIKSTILTRQSYHHHSPNIITTTTTTNNNNNNNNNEGKTLPFSQYSPKKFQHGITDPDLSWTQLRYGFYAWLCHINNKSSNPLIYKNTLRHTLTRTQYTYAYIYIHTHAYIHTHIYTHAHAHTHTHTHTHTYIYIYIHTHKIQTVHPIPNGRPDQVLRRKGNFAVPAEHWVKMKESERIDKFLALARELKKLCHMKVTMIPIVVAALETVPKSLEKKLEELETRRRTEKHIIVKIS